MEGCTNKKHGKNMMRGHKRREKLGAGAHIDERHDEKHDELVDSVRKGEDPIDGRRLLHDGASSEVHHTLQTGRRRRMGVLLGQPGCRPSLADSPPDDPDDPPDALVLHFRTLLLRIKRATSRARCALGPPRAWANRTCWRRYAPIKQ